MNLGFYGFPQNASLIRPPADISKFWRADNSWATPIGLIKYVQPSTPSSPNDGDLWYDTSQSPQTIWQWNATASLWLSHQIFKYVGVWTGIAANQQFYFATQQLSAFNPDIYVDELQTTQYVAAPNNGTNNWVVLLGKLDVPSAITTIAGPGLGTGLDTAANWTNHARGSNTRVNPASFPMLYLQVNINVGAPGLTYGCAVVNYRWVHP